MLSYCRLTTPGHPQIAILPYYHITISQPLDILRLTYCHIAILPFHNLEGKLETVVIGHRGVVSKLNRDSYTNLGIAKN